MLAAPSTSVNPRTTQLYNSRTLPWSLRGLVERCYGPLHPAYVPLAPPVGLTALGWRLQVTYGAVSAPGCPDLGEPETLRVCGCGYANCRWWDQAYKGQAVHSIDFATSSRFAHPLQWPFKTSSDLRCDSEVFDAVQRLAILVKGHPPGFALCLEVSGLVAIAVQPGDEADAKFQRLLGDSDDSWYGSSRGPAPLLTGDDGVRYHLYSAPPTPPTGQYWILVEDNLAPHVRLLGCNPPRLYSPNGTVENPFFPDGTVRRTLLSVPPDLNSTGGLRWEIAPWDQRVQPVPQDWLTTQAIPRREEDFPEPKSTPNDNPPPPSSPWHPPSAARRGSNPGAWVGQGSSGDGRWRSVRASDPCPRCGRGSACRFSPDGLLFCHERDRDVHGWRVFGTSANGVWVMCRPEGEGFAAPRREQGYSPPPIYDDVTPKVLAAHKQQTEAAMRYHADVLGVSVESLNRLKAAAIRHPHPGGMDHVHQHCWYPYGVVVFGTRDGEGRYIGQQYRDPRAVDRKYRFIDGGHAGLFFADDWREAAGPILCPEGPSDTAGLVTLGLAAVGRPNNCGGAAELEILLRDISQDRDIVLLAEHDLKEDGSWPGKEGPEKVARTLAGWLDRPVFVCLPPHGYKDFRVWLGDQIVDFGDEASVTAARDKWLAHVAEARYVPTPTVQSGADLDAGPTQCARLPNLMDEANTPTAGQSPHAQETHAPRAGAPEFREAILGGVSQVDIALVPQPEIAGAPATPSCEGGSTPQHEARRCARPQWVPIMEERGDSIAVRLMQKPCGCWDCDFCRSRLQLGWISWLTECIDGLPGDAVLFAVQTTVISLKALTNQNALRRHRVIAHVRVTQADDNAVVLFAVPPSTAAAFSAGFTEATSDTYTCRRLTNRENAIQEVARAVGQIPVGVKKPIQTSKLFHRRPDDSEPVMRLSGSAFLGEFEPAFGDEVIISTFDLRSWPTVRAVVEKAGHPFALVQQPDGEAILFLGAPSGYIARLSQNLQPRVLNRSDAYAALSIALNAVPAGSIAPIWLHADWCRTSLPEKLAPSLDVRRTRLKAISLGANIPAAARHEDVRRTNPLVQLLERLSWRVVVFRRGAGEMQTWAIDAVPPPRWTAGMVQDFFLFLSHGDVATEEELLCASRGFDDDLS